MTAAMIDETIIRETLRQVVDPELDCNIVDLGLVYDCHVEPLPAGGNRVEVKMTLTPVPPTETNTPLPTATKWVPTATKVPTAKPTATATPHPGPYRRA